MPPKQKEAKKGPNYKASTAPKDIVPSSVKEPPRDYRALRVPENFPQNQEKNEEKSGEFCELFEEWPSQQAIKGYDFGINSQATFEDQDHQKINQYIEKEHSGENLQWKGFSDLQKILEKVASEYQVEEPKIQKKKESEQAQEENEEEKGPVVIQTFMREETQQEAERRKKQQAEKAEKAKEKKKGKKQEQKEEGLMQISDVKMGNILVKDNMSSSGIWIGSQLQIIKQRNLNDVYSDEAVWKKIYPQDNGVPQITQSGKYWVKLYYMGKPIKIQVDDRVPLCNEKNILFPLSQKLNERWTLILTKALIKYFMKASLDANIVGSGLIIYALTGMITENISLAGFRDWKKISRLMQDDHYKNKDIIFSCYSDYGKKNKSSSNYIRSAEEACLMLNLENSTFNNKKLDEKAAYNLNNFQEGDEMYIESEAIGGYAYCLGDYFYNQDFNMVFSQQKTPKQIQLRNEYNQMSKVTFANKTREQKLEHRRKKKEIKESLVVEEKKRVEQINKPKKDYHFMKILSNLKIYCEYSDKEILLAKKCVLNNLAQPPNYDIPIEKEESTHSISLIKMKDEGEQIRPLDDFSSILNAKEVFRREDEGIWIKNEDLFTTFSDIQIYYNPNIFENKSIEQVDHKGAEMFSYDEEKQILVIEKIGNPHEQEKKEEQIEEKMEQNKQKNQQKIDLLFGFSVQESKWDTLSKPYSMLQKFDFESYRTTSNAVTLNKSIASTCLQLKNQNSVFKLYTMSKGRYSYWLGSNAPYKLLSIAQYLTDYEGYTVKSIPIQYPALENATYSQLARIKISHEGQQNNTILLKFNNCPKYVEQYLSYRLVKIPSNGKYTLQEQEGVISKPFQTLHLAYEYTRITLQPASSYYLIIEAYPSENIPDGSLDFVLISKVAEASIQLIEQVQPAKIVEKYVPNKYGTILKERLFANNPSNVGLLFKVVEGEEGQAQGGGGGGKGGKKGGKEESAVEIIEKPMSQKRLIHLKLLKGQELIYYQKGFNEIVVPNIEFESTKSEEVEYSIEASFDLRQWPEASQQNEENNKIYWALQVSGQDSIAVVRDTIQQEKQKETRKSWEDQQQGRAEKAKKARQRFLLQMKKQQGDELTEEQLQIINAPRLTKKQLQEQQKKTQEKKGKGAKKEEKKGAKQAKKEEAQEEKPVERQLPKSTDNFMTQVKEFLHTLEECKVSYVKMEEGDAARIRTQEQQKALRQGALMSKQNRIGQLARNIEVRETMKLKQKDKKDKLTILMEDLKEQYKNQWTKYIQWRTEDQEKDKVRQQKEKSLIDILKMEKPTISEADLSKMLAEYREINGHNSKLADVGDMLRKNIKIGGIVEKLNNHLSNWEVDELKAILEEITNEKVEGIEEEVMKQVNQMLEEAEKNPAMVQEKQAEMKKGKKGGKK